MPSSTEHYIDLAYTMLRVTVQILRVDTEQENAKVEPVNNFIHSLFDQVDILFNQKLASPPNNAYPYRAYIETLLNYAPPALQSHLTAVLWYVDTAGNIDAASTIARTASKANIGLLNRQYFTLGGKSTDLIEHLHCDVFNQSKFVLNGVEMRVGQVRNKDAFCLMDSSENGKFSVNIKRR